MTTAGVDLDVAAAFEALLAVEAASWKHAHGTAITAIAHQAAFYRALVREMAAAGALHLSFLTVGGQTIAPPLTDGVMIHRGREVPVGGL